MPHSERQPRLAKIKKKLEEVVDLLGELDPDERPDNEEGSKATRGGDEEFIGCTPKVLPTRLLVDAAKTARTINPMNAPLAGPLAAAGPAFAVDEPLRIAVVTAKYWGPTPRRLTVSFMEQTGNDLKSRILSHLKEWSKHCCISFVLTNGTGQVRISRGGGGYWSYLGTDILHIPQNRQTMNLEAFTMNTRDSEYKRVVRHECGHTLGFPHEHMRADLVRRIDPQKATQYFWETNRWPPEMVRAQVLTPLDDRTIIGTPVDQDSIMCYQLPGTITKDGKPIRGGTDINATDAAFASRIYPKSGADVPEQAPMGHGEASADEDDWSDEQDVSSSAALQRAKNS